MHAARAPPARRLRAACTPPARRLRRLRARLGLTRR
jgi:hypothetical protein